MPRGDRTGPNGMGPMTGRGAGFCAGYGMPGYANPLPGRGFWGRGRGGGGGGRGWRNWFYATGLTGWQRAAYGWPHPYPVPVPNAPTTFQASKEEELDRLRGQLEYQEDILDGLRKRIAELEGQSGA